MPDICALYKVPLGLITCSNYNSWLIHSIAVPFEAYLCFTHKHWCVCFEVAIVAMPWNSFFVCAVKVLSWHCCFIVVCVCCVGVFYSENASGKSSFCSWLGMQITVFLSKLD